MERDKKNNKINFAWQLSLTVFLLLFFSSCEKDISVDLPRSEDKLVVEGFIETGQFPYIVLTRNFSFFGGNDAFKGFSDLLVHGADVKVMEGGKEYAMNEFCLSTLPAAFRPLIEQFLGINLDSLPPGFDYCVYLNTELRGEVGKSYRLEVRKDSTYLEASTFLPPVPPIDSLWAIPDSSRGDSLYWLWCRFREPDTLGNFYRYFTKRNGEPFYPNYFRSVLDDQFANGQLFTFILERGYPRNSDIDFRTYGLFEAGDTVVVKITMIDYDHFRFWETIEDQWRSGGPFATPTYVQSNVKNGLGIWGGYSPTYDTIIIPK